MRDLKPSWPRWMMVLTLAVGCWWVIDQIEPEILQIEQRSCEKIASDVLKKELVRADGLIKSDDAKQVLVQSVQASGQVSGCVDTLREHLKAFVRVSPAHGRGVLEVESFREADEIRVAVRLIERSPAGEHELFARTKSTNVPDGTSLLAPFFAVLLALLTRQILFSLAAAIFLGAMFIESGAPVEAFLRVVDNYGLQTVTDPDKLYIIGFTLVLVGTIHICIAMGGMQGIVNLLNRRAKSVRSAQISTAIMGLAVFFDDYANSVVVGSAARPMTDAKRISREKLAYIVDSTAAPVAGIAVISTWIGFEIGLFDELSSLTGTNGYDFFFEVLPYRFYCLFALAMVFLVAWSSRDFGPMLKAERRARRTGQVAPGVPGEMSLGKLPETQPKKGVPIRAINGFLPIFGVIFGTFVAFVNEGRGGVPGFSWTSPGDWTQAFVKVENNLSILFWASVGGMGLALLLAFSQRLLTFREALKAWTRGARSMVPALAILILAIGVQQVTKDMGTDRFLVALLSGVDVWLIPVTTFLLAATVAFSTGTSWGTMGILLPVAIPLAYSLAGGDQAGVANDQVHLTVVLVGAAVLDGAIFGDHCSLISDTTVMSSMASSCDHVEHVRTQMPYAIVAMLAAAGAGYLLIAMPDTHIPVWVSYPLGLLFMYGVIRIFGKTIEERPQTGEQSAAPDPNAPPTPV